MVCRLVANFLVSRIGYIQHLDTERLSAIASELNADIFVRMIPGQLVDPTKPVAAMVGPALKGGNKTTEEDIAKCFSVKVRPSFDQDPRFGASVLSEIASRALSPAVNEPGTAIDVIGRTLRVLAVWIEPVENGVDGEVLYPNVLVPAIALDDIFDDLFTPIARDGAALVEIGIRLQKAFATLANFDQSQFREAAQRHSQEALARASLALSLKNDLHKVRNAAAHVASAAITKTEE